MKYAILETAGIYVFRFTETELLVFKVDEAPLTTTKWISVDGYGSPYILLGNSEATLVVMPIHEMIVSAFRHRERNQL